MIRVLISLSVHRTMTALPAPSCFLAGPQHLTRSEPLPIKRDIPQLIVGKAPSGILSKMKSHPEPPSPPNSVLLPVGVGWMVNRNSFINPRPCMTPSGPTAGFVTKRSSLGRVWGHSKDEQGEVSVSRRTVRSYALIFHRRHSCHGGGILLRPSPPPSPMYAESSGS
jgi:hypothetical protein